VAFIAIHRGPDLGSGVVGLFMLQGIVTAWMAFGRLTIRGALA
jgi:hypothetical protein